MTHNRNSHFLKALLIFFACLIISVNGQIGDINEALKYYPLHIGNYWEYETFRFPLSDTPDTSWIFSKEVTGDTTISGKKFFIVETKRLSGDFLNRRFYRIDSTTGGLYNGNFKEDSLLADIGDTVSPCFILSDLKEENILGEDRLTRTLDQSCLTSGTYYKWKLSKGLGETYRLTVDEVINLRKYRTYLIYAKIDGKEFGIKTDVSEDENFDKSFSLSQNYPNPFNPSTTIKFTVGTSPSAPLLSNLPAGRHGERDERVRLVVYNMLGQKIRTLVNETLQPGNYEVEFDGSDLTSGIYFYVLESGGKRLSKKMLLLK